MVESHGLLMHKNIQVANILFVNGHPVEIVEILTPEHLPLGVNSAESLVVWLERRNMPFDRPFCGKVLEEYGIMSGSDFSGISHNASLTDCYWFADVDEIEDGVKWEYINPRTVEWGMGGEAIFSGHPELVDNLESPDFATGGYLPKVWVREPDGIFMLKRDGKSGLNTFAEIAASEVASALNVSHVPYFFSITNGEVCAGCTCITASDEEEMVLFSSLADEIGGADNLQAYIADAGFKGEFARMQVFDFLVGNWSRSLDDIALVRNPDDLSVYGFSPLYDFGDSFTDTEDEDAMRSMMARARSGIRYMEGVSLDIEDIHSRFLRICSEIELATDFIAPLIQNFDKRADIYNHLIRSAV